MILVTTGGKVGSEAALMLARKRVPVRVLARDPQKASALAEAGVEVVKGDLEVPETLHAALEGVSGVVLVSPAILAQEVNVVDTAMRAKVQHIVKITSDASEDSPIERRRGQAAIEKAIIASGIGYTFLRSNAYMQNLLMLGPAIAETDSFASSTGEGRIGMIDARDVGAVAAEIAAAPEAHVGATYWPTGSEALSYRDAADVFTKVLGREITFRSITSEEQKQAMVDAGLPEIVAEDNAKALEYFAKGDSDYVTGDVPTILGRPARTFEQFVTDYAPAYS